LRSGVAVRGATTELRVGGDYCKDLMCGFERKSTRLMNGGEVSRQRRSVQGVSIPLFSIRLFS
jgi:hypothetical protein